VGDCGLTYRKTAVTHSLFHYSALRLRNVYFSINIGCERSVHHSPSPICPPTSAQLPLHKSRNSSWLATMSTSDSTRVRGFQSLCLVVLTLRRSTSSPTLNSPSPNSPSPNSPSLSSPSPSPSPSNQCQGCPREHLSPALSVEVSS
jgi:hypothetical protein